MNISLKDTRVIALIGIFGALHGVLAIFPGLTATRAESGWIPYYQPLGGIILGPTIGFCAALIGFTIGRLLAPRGLILLFFSIGEILAITSAGWIIKGQWKFVTLLMVGMLFFYFISPVSWSLPIWALWDIYIGCLLIPLIPRTGNLLKSEDTKSQLYSLMLTAYISNEVDVLFRVFLLIPLNFYSLLGIPFDFLPLIWIQGAIETPIDAILTVCITTVVGLPLLRAIKQENLIDYPLS